MDDNTLPRATTLDHVHLAVKAALSTIPMAGGPAAELFAAIIAPPLAKRRDRWLEALAEKLRQLEERVSDFSIESLANSEEFVSVVIATSTAAMRTHQAEKLDALRNALLNVAMGRAPDVDQQAIFLRYVEELTPWHLRLLKFLEGPKEFAAKRNAWPNMSLGGLERVLELSFPELVGRREFYDQLVRDLNARGLTSSGNDILHVVMTPDGLAERRTTEQADRFLAFIAEPVELQS